MALQSTCFWNKYHSSTESRMPYNIRFTDSWIMLHLIQ